MPVINTGDLQPGALAGGHLEVNHQVYCGLDSCLTHEIWGALRALHPTPPPIYRFSLGLQAPYMEIMQRGFRVNETARRQASESLRGRAQALQGVLNSMAQAVWDRPLNPSSPKQLQEFFYDRMALPAVWLSTKGERKVSTGREALERLDERYLHARPFVRAILSLRGIQKELSVIDGDVDSDGRFRAGYNIAGTETGRPSSSENAFGTGGNAQNIAPSLRYIFVSDGPGHADEAAGWKMAVIDLEQVEARDVGWFCGCLFDDWDLLDACESGDLHTNNAKRIWPELPWTNDPTRDRHLADANFYRNFSYRDMAKRGSHLSNYMGTSWTAARALKVPLPMMEEFQARYCRGPTCAFPAIARWWGWTAEQLQLTQQLTTPFGFRRHFFGRPGDDTTLREAIAFLPQSTTAHRMNLGLWRVWKHMPDIQLLAQTYDSITFQYPDRGPEFEGEILSRALGLIRVELTHPSGRSYVVPGEAKIGWNWGNQEKDGSNPLGLTKWSVSQPDLRVRPRGADMIAGGLRPTGAGT